MSKNATSLPKSAGERLVNGLFKENPTFVLLLGMCPTLAVTTSAMNGLGMGLTTMVVLAMSNLIISALRKVIPDKIRIPAFIVIIASFVTIVELLLEAYVNSLYEALGIYIPLIVVNCIILGRAEAYAYSHPVIPSLFDGIGMGLGFTMALTIIGGVREILGTGAIFGTTIMPASYVPVNIFVMAPGAFFVLAILTAIQNKIKDIGESRGHDMSKIQSGCGGNCMECNKECKVELAKPVEEVKTEEVKSEEPKTEETKPEEVKDEEPKVEEVKPEETKTEEPKAEEPAAEEPKTEKPEKEEKSEEEVKKEAPDDDFEIIDLDDYKKAAGQKNKPKHKKGNKNKALQMLNKAEESLKEDENND